MQTASTDLLNIDKDDVLLDLVGNWFRLARDAHERVVTLIRTLSGFYTPESDSAQIYVLVDKRAWQKLADLATRPAPALALPVGPAVSQCESYSPTGGMCALPFGHRGVSHRAFNGTEWLSAT